VANELNPIVVSIPNWGWWNCIYHYISTHQTSAPRHINNAPKIAPNLTFKHLCIHQHIPQKNEHHKAMRMAQWSCWTPLPMVQRISPGCLGGMAPR
jgi:hypothetical protein